MSSQLPPVLWSGRGPAGRIALIVGLIVGVPVALAIGLLLFVVGVVFAIVAIVLWLVGAAVAWVWFAVQRMRRIPYPFALQPPDRRRPRIRAFSSLYLSLVPRVIGGIARVAGVLLSPLALLASVAGLFSVRWRAHPYVAVFTLPALLLKVVNLGRRRGLLRDGHDALTMPYDDYLASAFPLLRDFLRWWRDPHAPHDYTPTPGLPDVPAGLTGLHLGPYPDPLGYPGLAAGAMRRRSIRTLRDVFLSQREIDDLCDPDLDDRAETGLIRICLRRDERGVRHWIVQFPSTKSWDPRAGTAPNDLTADLVIGAGREATATRVALETMRAAGIGPGEPVMLAGFSLGGMVASQVAMRAAADGYTVTHLVVGGSPLGRTKLPAGLHVLALEHVLDPVPRIDGRENPRPHARVVSATGSGSAASSGSASASADVLTVKAGPPLPVGFRIGALHQSIAYADTAAELESDPPDPRVAAILAELRPFFGAGQEVVDHATLRAGAYVVQPSVPFYLHSTVKEGITRGTLRVTLRRIPDVIATDVYLSRAGFATTIVWNADVLVRSLEPWFTRVERFAVYRGLLSLLQRRPAIGLHFRLKAKESPGVTWETTVQRMGDGSWREVVDVTFDDDAARAEFDRAFPGGAAPAIRFYPPDAFDPILATPGG